MPDLYAILGVGRSATADEIKSAYRTLARKLHPDINKADDAQKKFAELQQAYEILSDDNKRKRYDRTGRTDNGPDPFAGAQGGFRADSPDFDDFGEMFDAFFRGRGGGPQQAQRGRAQRPSPPPSPDIRAPLSLDLETIDKAQPVKTRTPDGEVVSVSIPPAVAAGATIRLKGRGRQGPRGKGDLLLEIRVKPHDTITRGAPGKPDNASLDLTTRADVSIADATLGGTINVDRLGQTIRLTVPPATPSGRSLRARGKGLTNAAGRAGDLFVELRIVPPDPESLSDTDRATLRRIAASADAPPESAEA